MRFIFLYLVALATMVCFAQNTDEKLAAQFYENGEYEKAETLYKKLHKKNEESQYLYENYLRTLLALKDEKEASKLIEKQIKKNPTQLNFQVDLGYIFVQFDQKETAEKYFDKLIRLHEEDRVGLTLLAQSFDRRGLTDYRILALERGAKRQGVLVFFEELSVAYRYADKTKDLVDFTLEALRLDRQLLGDATRRLDPVFEKEEDATYLQNRTLYYIQKNPSNQVFEELLLDIFLQQKKYKSALKQVISLDKRNQEKGGRVLQLAELCINNRAYNEAIDAYTYVINLGQNETKFNQGQNGLINALYLKTTGSIAPNKEEVKSLIDKINIYIATQGMSRATAYSQFRLAELHIFYNDNVPAGIAILEEITRVSNLQTSFVAECKLLLGDAYLMVNNIWDAKLMYGQVDKQFKEDALGQLAKFKNAKLSYYTGDFDWAKDQLDILKTATSQLISNNAIELSLLIQDNTGLDTTNEAMQEYAAAEFFLYQNKIAQCLEILNMLPFKYPNHTLNDEIVYLKAHVQEKLGNYEAALKLYTVVYEKYSEDILADNALYRAANITLFVNGNEEKAQSLFEKLVLNYNSSLFVVDARRFYFALKEGKTKEELFSDFST